MARTNPATIILVGDPLIKEKVTSVEVFAGHLIQISGNKDISKQVVAKANCAVKVVVEDSIIGKEIRESYKADDLVKYACFTSGQEVYIRVSAAAPAIAKHDALEADGQGCVRKFTDGVILGNALEAIDNSSGATEVFIRMEVL